MIVEQINSLIPEECESTEPKCESESESSNNKYNNLFWKLRPQGIENNLEKLNKKIVSENVTNKQTYKRSIRIVIRDKFIIIHALFIEASGYIHQGEMLWRYICGNQKKKRRDLLNDADFGRYIKWWKLNQIKHFIPFGMEYMEMKDSSVDWWNQ